jgi:hypothetical protein
MIDIRSRLPNSQRTAGCPKLISQEPELEDGAPRMILKAVRNSTDAVPRVGSK